MLDAERARLLAQVGVLAAGHLVAVHVGGPGADFGFERRVVAAHPLPVHRRFVQALQAEAGIALAAGQGRGDARQVGLRGQPAHGVERAVDRIAAGLDRGQCRSGRDAAGVVGMEMHRQPGLFLERLDQRPGRLRTADACHVLDAQHMHAGLLQLARDADVVLQVVLGARLVEQVAGIADRAFAQHAAFADGIDRDTHIAHPVQRIEHAEHIHAGAGGLAHEEAHHVVGIVGVADRVGSTQQHLEQHVGHALAQFLKALPWVFLEEAQCHVEGGAAPALQREQLRQLARIERRDRQHVGGAHARGEQRLVRVAHGGVRQQHLLLLQHPARKLLRAQIAQPVARTVGQRAAGVDGGQHRCGQRQRWQRAAAHLRVPVDADLAQVPQQLGGAVQALGERQQFRRQVDKARGGVAGAERGMVDDVLEELQVGRDAADAELAQRTVHAPDRFGRGRCPGGDLDQQRIVVRRDHRAAICGAGIEAHTEAGRAAVGGEAAIVRQEAVLRVLGGDPALQRMTVQRNRFLHRHARGAHDDLAVFITRVLGHADMAAFGHADLRLDDVDPGDHLRDRVLDLDARIDFDEVELAGVGIHQEFDRAGMRVADRAHQPQGRFAQRGPAGIVEVWRGRALDHLLVAPLHGTVALIEMH